MTTDPSKFFMIDGPLAPQGNAHSAIIAAEFPYSYHWNREGRKDQPCRVTARGKMNSCCVEFGDGFKMVTSRNALRKRKI